MDGTVTKREGEREREREREGRDKNNIIYYFRLKSLLSKTKTKPNTQCVQTVKQTDMEMTARMFTVRTLQHFR